MFRTLRPVILQTLKLPGYLCRLRRPSIPVQPHARSVESPKALNITRPLQVQNKVNPKVDTSKQTSASSDSSGNLMQLKLPPPFPPLQLLFLGFFLSQPLLMLVDAIEQLLNQRTVKSCKRCLMEYLSLAFHLTWPNLISSSWVTGVALRPAFSLPATFTTSSSSGPRPFNSPNVANVTKHAFSQWKPIAHLRGWSQHVATLPEQSQPRNYLCNHPRRRVAQYFKGNKIFNVTQHFKTIA